MNILYDPYNTLKLYNYTDSTCMAFYLNVKFVVKAVGYNKSRYCVYLNANSKYLREQLEDERRTYQ